MNRVKGYAHAGDDACHRNNAIRDSDAAQSDPAR
jgi:hypothetical protein